MLDRDRVSQDLHAYVSRYSAGHREVFDGIIDQWGALCTDPLAAQKAHEREWPFLVPQWDGLLGLQFSIENITGDYSLFSVDGSQLYPERHQGIPCALVNIGTAAFSYGQTTSKAELFSKPYLITPNNLSDGEDAFIDEAFIRSLRTEYELKGGLETSALYKGAPFFFDGSLILWHMDESKKGAEDYFFKRYVDCFVTLEQQEVLHAGYISMPKSRELVNIMRALCPVDPALLRYFTDADLVASFLKPDHRTLLFKSRAHITSHYPPSVHPFFFYLNVGSEIARVEIPQWIAENEIYINKITSILIDQCDKGRGYPVCLAEAHEQAVVKAADREFFFACMAKWLNREGAAFISSRKSLLKKTAAI
ncbi:TPA: hypothetical protein DDZ86_04825 [Candidatus Dependentiae bacterium]|nr:MAG: hypothetical protein A2Y17_09630 [Clostridiales bacterium GWF2_38_85]HBL98936.1 hypothetical protein [Candidatus Dependentiae bacterium]